MTHCIIGRMLVYAGCAALQKSKYVIVVQMAVQAGCGALVSMVQAGRKALLSISLVAKESHDARLLCSIRQRAFQLLGFTVSDTVCKSKLCHWIFLLGVQLGYLLIKLNFLFFQLRHSVVDVCSLLAYGGDCRCVRVPACHYLGVEARKAADALS